MTATGGISIKTTDTVQSQSVCAKGNLGLKLDLTFKFTWMVYPGTGENSDFIEICAGFLNGVSGDILKDLPLPIKPFQELCTLVANAVPALKKLTGLNQEVKTINVLNKSLKLYCGADCKVAGALHFGAKASGSSKLIDRCPNPLKGETLGEFE